MHSSAPRSGFRRAPSRRALRFTPELPSSGGADLCLPGQTLIAGNAAELLHDGDQVLPRMLEAIRGARLSVVVEMYCFSDDFVGRRFARALAERAQQGVPVRVLVDAAGSGRTPRSFFGWMRKRGVRVEGVNPIRRFFLQGSPFRWRDHRKIVVIDGRSAFVGGLNLTKEYASRRDGGGGWRDSAVRVSGPVVAVLSASFEKLWREETRFGRPRAASPEPEIPPAAGETRALVLESRALGPGPFAPAFRHAVDRARERIWIANPYFLPPRSFRRALRRAARRGVDVRVLVPRRSDSAFVLRASQRRYSYYLRSGIRIFEWPGPMLHLKAAVVDGAWSTIGSYNIDPLSLLHNRELNLVLLGRETGRRFESMFREDFAAAEELEERRWTARGALRRLSEALCASFRVFL